ncbi:MAG: 3-phosphoshikimate 1-carboxyvinyltransferase, partial [Pseudomonadota bacterium]
MSSHSRTAAPLALTAAAKGPLTGRCTVPGDKSISHRSLMLGAIADGQTTIEGLLEGEDVLCTADAMRALGAKIERQGSTWRVDGIGLEGLTEPTGIIDLGNSGTAARLIAGLLAGRPMTSFMTGDASLTSRPMKRVTVPLSEMGARFETRQGGRMPMAVIGTDDLTPITYRLPVASAQVKSAVLLAGLSASGETVVEEPIPTRDHSERLLRYFGADVSVSPAKGGTPARIAVKGPAHLTGQHVKVPGDISSAAFPIVAALITGSQELRIDNVGVNPLRTGLLDTLIDMGADITLVDE